MIRKLATLLLLGVALSAPAVGAEEKKPARPDYDRIFPAERNLEVHLEVSRKDWDQLPRRPFSYVPCRLTLDGKVFNRAGLRLKGNSSSSVRSERKSFKIDFDRFEKKAHFHGITKLNFHNGFKDPTMLRETLAYGLFRSAGVPASRTAHARVFVTVGGGGHRRFLGLYSVVEQVDRRFLRDRFDDPSGALWKGEGLAEFSHRGGDPDQYGGFIQKLNENRGDLTPLLALVRVLTRKPDADLAKQLPAVFDVDSFLRFLAVNTLLGNLDAYVGTGHNFYLYHDPTRNRITFIPWDLNEAFGNFKMGSIRDMERMSIDQPYSGEKILVQRVLSVPAWKASYRKTLRELLDGPFSVSALGRQVERAWKKIRKPMEKDGNLSYPFEDCLANLDRDVRGGGRHDRGGIPGLRSFVTARIASVKAQLQGAERGVKPRGRDIFRPPPSMETSLRPACCGGADALFRIEADGSLLRLDLKTLAPQARAALPQGPPKAEKKEGGTRHELLDRLDRNGNGRIDRKEWRGSSRMFQALDKNGNNALDAEELENLPPPPGRDPRGGLPGRGGPESGEPQILTPVLVLSKSFLLVIRGGTLYRFDRQTLNVRGHNRFHQQERMGRGAAPRPARRAPAAFLDSDGLYTFDGETVRRFDVEKLVLQADRKIEIPADPATLFRALDRNRDGRIDWRELPGPPDTFQHFDRNRDGQLDEKELRLLPPEFSRNLSPEADAFGLCLLPKAVLVWSGKKTFLLKKKSLKITAEAGK